MAVRKIVRLGHPALRSRSEAVTPEELASASLQELIDDLLATVVEAEGVGLAAPQVGVNLQIFVYESEPQTEREPGRYEAVINPSVEPESEELEYDWEGCLSIPDLRGLVPRHPEVRLFGLDRHGAPIDRLLAGFTARVVQHEFDHLHGVIYLDRMRDLHSLTYEDEFEALLDEAEQAGESSAVG